MNKITVANYTLQISFLPAHASTDELVVETLTQLINHVYLDAENGLWKKNAKRTTQTEIAEHIHAGQIAVAKLEGHIVGAIKILKIDSTTGEFGMLVCHPKCRGSGIGQRLIEFAEEAIRKQGLKVMQLELLVPKVGTQETKELLKIWYPKLGYKPMKKGGIEFTHPQLAPLLAKPCELLVYQKSL